MHIGAIVDTFLVLVIAIGYWLSGRQFERDQRAICELAGKLCIQEYEIKALRMRLERIETDN
jgi:hypothetical protein